MSEMAGPEYAHGSETDQVPDEEQISAADAAERSDVDPDEQENKKDPIWGEGDERA